MSGLSFPILLLGLCCLLVIGTAIFKCCRGELNRWPALAITIAAIAMFSLSGREAGTEIGLPFGANQSAELQSRIDASKKKGDDLQQRLNVNSAAMQALTKAAGDPSPNAQKQRLEKLADIATQVKILEADRKAYIEETSQLQADVQASVEAHARRQVFWLAILANLLIFISLISYVRTKSRKRRIAERVALLREQGADPLDLSEAVKQLAGEGKTIAAIKTYREETGLGLAEAKQRVEAFMLRP